MTRILRLPFAILVLSPLGCGGCSKPGNVAGKVTFNGKPVVAGNVVVLGSDSLPYTGPISETGDFVVSNIPSGLAKFAVVSHNPATPQPSIRRAKNDAEPRPNQLHLKGLAGKWFPLPKRFADPNESGLAFNVRPGENSINLEMTTAAFKK